MLKKITGNFPYYYQVSLSVIISVSFVSLVYFWSSGFLDGTFTSSVYQSSQVVANLREAKTLEFIHDSVKKGEIDRAIKSIDYFEENIEKVDKLVNVKSYDELEKNGIKLKDSLSKLQNINNSDEAVRVFLQKIRNFEAFVNDNQWRTLSRLSDRIIAKFTSQNSYKNDLPGTIESTKRDILIMNKVTQSSILSDGVKKEISSRLDSLATELELLGGYSNNQTTFQKLFVSYQRSFDRWITEINPELALKKIEADKFGHYFLFCLIAIIALCGVMIAFGVTLQRKFKEEQSNRNEHDFINLVENNILGQTQLDSQYSFEFKNKFDKTKRYIKKRMMFGSIFQDSLPFPSLLLDKNLKVIWANKLFCETWSLEKSEINSEKISWEHVSSITNLGENDPVFEAVRSNIAGIYQVQIKFSEQTPSEPFEMYVCPIEYNNEKRIQVYFYSLSSVQDVISSQSKSIVGPVMRTLEALMKGQFDAHFQEQIHSDYQAANIENLYDKFLKYNDYGNIQREGLLAEIDRLEDSLYDYQKMVSDVNNLNTNVIHNNLELVKDLTTVRNRIIELSELSGKYKTINVELVNLLDENLHKYKSSISKNNNLFNAFEEGLKSIPSIDKFKEDLKVIKNEIINTKNKLTQSITKLTANSELNMRGDVDYKQASLMERVHSDLEILSETIGSLEKKMVFLEVQFSKTQMIFNEHKKTILDNKVDSEEMLFDRFKEKFRTHAQTLRELERKGEIIEDDVVSKLRNVYEGYKANTKTAIHLKEIVQEKKTEIITPKEKEVEGEA